MDPAEGWNDLGDYSLFFPDDSFNLFGEYDLNFNNFLAPSFDGIDNGFDLGGTAGPGALDPVQSDLNFLLPRLEEPPNLILDPEAEALASNHTSTSSPSSAQSPNSDSQKSTYGSTASWKEDQHQSKTTVTKRKFLTAFSVQSGEEVRVHTRKRYHEERKKEVAVNRMIGVCLHCKLRKVACNNGIPCDRCIKRAGDISFGQEICMRGSLVATRFGHIDLIKTVSTEQKLRRFDIPESSPIDRYACLWFPACPEMDAPEAFVMVPVIQFDRPAFQPNMKILSMDYHQRYECIVSDAKEAILPGPVPSVESLLQAYFITRRNYYSHPGPFAGLYKAFRDFVESYCNVPKDMPLKKLLNKILRMQRLFDMYRTMPSIKLAPNSEERSTLVSSTIWLQLRLPISKAISAIEAEVLSEVDRMIQCKSGMGRQNPLASWAALWLLILSYEEHLVFIKAWHRESQDIYDEKSCGLNQHLYNMLTSTYAALYKTTSPLTLDWRSKEVARMMGNYAHLINLFCNIKTEFYWFDAEKDRLSSDDTLFKTLVLENESKLINAHIKAAKRQGIL